MGRWIFTALRGYLQHPEGRAGNTNWGEARGRFLEEVTEAITWRTRNNSSRGGAVVHLSWGVESPTGWEDAQLPCDGWSRGRWDLKGGQGPQHEGPYMPSLGLGSSQEQSLKKGWCLGGLSCDVPKELEWETEKVKQERRENQSEGTYGVGLLWKPLGLDPTRIRVVCLRTERGGVYLPVPGPHWTRVVVPGVIIPSCFQSHTHRVVGQVPSYPTRQHCWRRPGTEARDGQLRRAGVGSHLHTASCCSKGWSKIVGRGDVRSVWKGSASC